MITSFFEEFTHSSIVCSILLPRTFFGEQLQTGCLSISDSGTYANCQHETNYQRK